MRSHPYVLLFGFGFLIWLVMELVRTGLIWVLLLAGMCFLIWKVGKPAKIAQPASKIGGAPMTERRANEVLKASNNLSDRFSSIDEALDHIPVDVRRLSGSVFYTGRAAFKEPSSLYLLGLNPGGSPTDQRDETIGVDIEQFRSQPELWSAYRDESWNGGRPGTVGMQPRVLHMLSRLGKEPSLVPASNVVFVRSSTEATLAHDKAHLLRACWPIHRAVINSLGITTIACFGGTAGRWVREMLGANQFADSYREQNARGWTSEAHISPNGICVLTLTHPSRANWCNSNSDPTPLVKRMLDRHGR